MTLVSLPSPIVWPGITGNLTGAPGLFTTATVDAAGEYVSYAICAKESMTISHVGFRAGTATGSPNIIVSIEGLDASGLPDGAATYGGSASAATLVASNTNPVIALGGSATITKGQTFCVKIAYSSGTSLVIQHSSMSVSFPVSNNLPYRIVNTGTPTKAALTGECPTVALGSSSTTFYQVPGFLPIASATTNGFNNTNSAKRGLRFTIPMNCRAIGLRFLNNNNAGNYNAVLYSDAGSELSSSSTAFDGDHSNLSTQAYNTCYFDNTVTLTAGTTYRIAIEPSSATNCNVSTVTLPSADYRGASPAGTTAHYTTFATASWTDSATDTLPLMDLVIDQVDDGTGSGSGGGQRVFGG
jgi:hypothetical protein